MEKLLLSWHHRLQLLHVRARLPSGCRNSVLCRKSLAFGYVQRS